MKTDEDRGPIGAWARNARIGAGYRTARLPVELAAVAGGIVGAMLGLMRRPT